MGFVWAITSAAVLLIVADFFYRQFASRRICRLFENVPLFGAVNSTPDYSTPTFQIPVGTDGSLVSCLLRPQGTIHGLVIFCPELHGDRWTALNYTSAIIQAGFAVLSFEFRDTNDNELQTDTPRHWVTESEVGDIEAVLQFVNADPELRKLPLGIFGVSRGGSAAIVAACRFPQISSVVTDGAYSTMGMLRSFISRYSRFVVPDWFFNRLPAWHVELTLRQAVRYSEKKCGCRDVDLEVESRNFRQPILLLSGKRDSYVTPAVTWHLADCLDALESVWIVGRAKHNKSREVAQDEYDDRVIDHLHQTLCPSADLNREPRLQSQSSVA